MQDHFTLKYFKSLVTPTKSWRELTMKQLTTLNVLNEIVQKLSKSANKGRGNDMVSLVALKNQLHILSQ